MALTGARKGTYVGAVTMAAVAIAWAACLHPSPDANCCDEQGSGSGFPLAFALAVAIGALAGRGLGAFTTELVPRGLLTGLALGFALVAASVTRLAADAAGYTAPWLALAACAAIPCVVAARWLQRVVPFS
jgi:hypothetical protein